MLILLYTERAVLVEDIYTESLKVYYIRQVYRREAYSCHDRLQDLLRALVSSALYGVPTATHKGRDNNSVRKIPVKPILRAGS